MKTWKYTLGLKCGFVQKKKQFCRFLRFWCSRLVEVGGCRSSKEPDYNPKIQGSAPLSVADSAKPCIIRF